MTNRLSTLLMVSAAMLLASCSNTLTCGNSHPYANYNPAAPLKAPAGVTMPAPDPAYVVPAAGTAAKPTLAPAASTNGAQPCLVRPPNVLTKADMAAPPKTAAPAKPTVPIGTHPESSGKPPAEQGLPPPPVASRRSME